MLESDLRSFEDRLVREGYSVDKKSIEPSLEVGDHSHDYDVLGVVVDGEISITRKGQTDRYTTGEEFYVAAGQSHSEAIGPQGVSIVVGRK